MSDLLSQHIITLLRRHDCVIVPGVGAFVATCESATLSGDVLAPPSRRVVFNPDLLHDDGLLASSYARRMKIPFEHAREKVAAEAALLHRRLKAEGVVTINRVGTLHRRAGGRLEFVPEGAWTLPLPLIRAAQAAPQFEVVKPAASESDKAVAVVRVPLHLRWIRVAAAAVILFGISFALTTPISMNDAQHASLAAPAITAPEAENWPAPDEPVGLELKIAIPAVEPVATTAIAIEQPAPVAPAPYVVIVASLPTPEKAEEYIASQGIASLQVLRSGDKYRIYTGEGNSPEEAMANANKLSGFSSRYPDAWVCRR